MSLWTKHVVRYTNPILSQVNLWYKLSISVVRYTNPNLFKVNPCCIIIDKWVVRFTNLTQANLWYNKFYLECQNDVGDVQVGPDPLPPLPGVLGWCRCCPGWYWSLPPLPGVPGLCRCCSGWYWSPPSSTWSARMMSVMSRLVLIPFLLYLEWQNDVGVVQVGTDPSLLYLECQDCVSVVQVGPDPLPPLPGVPEWCRWCPGLSRADKFRRFNH